MSRRSQTASRGGRFAGQMASARLRAVTYLPAYVVPAALGLAVIPALTRLLGPREFGIYATCLSIHGCLLAFSADPATGSLSRFYAMAAGAEERSGLLKGLLGLSLALSMSVMALALATTFLGSLFLDEEWVLALSATAVMTAGFAVFQYLLTVRYVQERAVATSASQVAHSIAKTAALIAGAGAVGTAAGSLAAYAVSCLALVIVLGPAVVRQAGRLVDRELWFRALRYGVPLIAASLSYVALAGFDRAMLVGAEGEAVAGRYAAAYLVAEGAVSIPALVLRYTVFTSIVAAYQSDDADRVRRLILRAGDGVLLAAAPVVVLFALAGGSVIEAIGGREYAVSNLVPTLLAIGVVASRLGGLESIGFQLSLDSRGLARAYLYATTVALPLTAVLVVAAGIEGAAIATVGSYTAFYLLVRFRSPERALTSYPREHLAVAILAIGSVVAIGLLVSRPAALAVGAIIWTTTVVMTLRR